MYFHRYNRIMPATIHRSATAEHGSRRLDLVIGALGLLAALAVLPLPTVGVTPEVAATLAVGAVALLAGQRWGLAVVVLADIAQIGALWPRAFLHDPPSTMAQIGVAIGIAGALPGLISLGRAAPELAELVLGHASPRGRAMTRVAMVLGAVLCLAGPLI